MKQSASQGARDPDTDMVVSPSTGGPHMRTNRNVPSSMPRWVKVSAIIILVLILLFVALHLSEHGFGDHMHMSGM